jgi:transcription termination/antitermination protein NusG
MPLLETADEPFFSKCCGGKEVAPCEVLHTKTGAGEDHARVAALSNWYAVYVKSRHEFVAAAELTRKGIETYLPVVRKVSQWKDRKKLIELPLFPGYVFVRVPVYPGAFLDVLKTRGIVAFVSLEPGAPTPVSADEINSLRILIGTGRDLDVFPGLKEGMKVRVKHGPLAGVEGVLSRKENEFLFLVNIELLGRSVAVKVVPQDIEAA